MPETAHTDVDEIGFAAGRVWGFLNDNGPSSMHKVVKNLDVPRELAMQAVGGLT